MRLVHYIIFLLLLPTNFAVTLPSGQNLTALRLNYAKTCRQYSCIYRWIRGDQNEADVDDLIRNRCSKELNGKNISTLSLYDQKKVDWRFISGYYSYLSYHFYCHRECGFLGSFLYYQRFLEYQLQVANARADNQLCGSLEDSYCRWWAYMIKFRIYFSYFAIPATLVANFLNLSILNHMLGSRPGPALYLHLAEVISDAVYNLILNFHDALMFFSSFDRWRTTCAYNQYSSTFQLFGVLKRYLAVLNQAYLTGLVADRLYAMVRPMKYSSGGVDMLRKRGKMLVLKIFFGCTFLYLPFLLYRNFYPIIKFWKKQSDTWKSRLEQLDAAVVVFYTSVSFAFIIVQAVCGILVEKSYRKFLASQSKQESKEQLKKRETDKRLLLAGTIGLNLVAGTVI